MNAAGAGNIQLVNYLCDQTDSMMLWRGLDRALCAAARRNQLITLQKLLSCGATQVDQALIDSASGYSDNREVVEFLLTHQVSPQAVNRALNEAAYMGNRNVVQVLLDHGANNFDEAIDSAYKTPCRPEIIRLIKSYCDRHHNPNPNNP